MSRWGAGPAGAAVALIAAIWATPPVAGQSTAFQFSFSNPGARSMGFGGAFVGLADDATAAFANPAGLVQLIEPEISIEGRSWNYSVPYFSGGRLEGQPTGIGLDTEPGIRSARSKVDLEGISFLSFVYPRKRWSVAFYRHQLAKFGFASETQGVFWGDPQNPSRRQDIRVTTDFQIVSHGVAAGFRVADRLSLGLGLSQHRGDIRFTQGDYLWDADNPGAFFGRNSFLPERRISSTLATADDRDWGLTVGLLWHHSDGRWSIGGFYRQGPELEAAAIGAPGPAATGSQRRIEGPLPLEIPDVFGMGIAFRSSDGRLTAGFDWDWVKYSNLVESAERGIERLSGETSGIGTVDDALEVHLGAEYVFLRSDPLLAVRWGVWLDPDHLIRFSPNIDLGSDEFHFALGLGAAFKRIQIDLGADFSDQVDTVSVSAIYSF